MIGENSVCGHDEGILKGGCDITGEAEWGTQT